MFIWKASLLALLEGLLCSKVFASTSVQFTNSTLKTNSSGLNTYGPTHSVTDYAFGYTMACVGPTGPPGLKFPIQTVVQKLTEVSGPTTGSYYFADAHGKGTHIPFTATGPTTLSTTFVRELVPQFEPYQHPLKCCGQCTVYFSSVDLLYWPVPGANTACLDEENSNAATATVPPSNNSITTMVGDDGFTYTSPSVYVAYHDISASNLCGQVGAKHTSITIALDPDQVSTVPYSSSMFGRGYNGSPKPFDFKDLPCPPQSLIDAQEAANDPLLSLPMRRTYAPIIYAPPAIRSLEPAWNTCMSFLAFDPPKTLTPATAMVPSPTAAKLAESKGAPAVPNPTIDGPPVKTSSPGNEANGDPSSNPSDPKGGIDPIAATDPNHHSGGNEPSSSDLQNAVSNDGGSSSPDASPDMDPAPSLNNPKDANQPANAANQRVQIGNNISDSQGTSNSGGGSKKFGDPPANGANGVSPSEGSPDNAVNGPVNPADPKAQTGNNVPSVSGNQGTSNNGGGSSDPSKPPANGPMNVLPAGGSQPEPQGSPNNAGSQLAPPSSKNDVATSDSTPQANDHSNPQGGFNAGGFALTPQADSGVIVAGNTLSVNGPAATVSEKVISLASESLIIDGHAFAVPNSPPQPNEDSNPQGNFNAEGFAVTPQPGSGFLVAGNTLSINGPATIISGKLLSVASAGLVIDGQTFAILTPVPAAAPTSNPILTIGGQTIQPLSNHNVLIQGATLSPNGPATTLSGTPISLASSALIIAGQTYTLPTSTPVPSKPGNNVVINGIILTAGASAVTISNTPISLALGSSGLYVTGLGSGAAAFSAPVIAGESMAVDSGGKVMVDGKVVGDSGAGGGDGKLGDAIMLGFGAASTGGATSPSSGSSGGAAGGDGNGNGSAPTGVLDFAGEGRRGFEVPMRVVSVLGAVVLGWHVWDLL